MNEPKFVPLNNGKIAVVELLKNSKIECTAEVACMETAKYKINSCLVLHILNGKNTSSKGTYEDKNTCIKFISGKKIFAEKSNITCYNSIDPVLSYRKESLQNGVLKKYDNTGNIKSETTFEKNLKNGPENLYVNGKIVRSTIYSAGKKVGQETGYYPNETSSVHVVRNYKSGYLDGIQQRYFSNGQINVLGCYKNSRKDGKFELTDEKGVVLATAEFSRGFAEGEFIIYENGEEKYIAEFYYNRPNGSWSEIKYFEYLPKKLVKGADYDKVIKCEDGGVFTLKNVYSIKYKHILEKFEFDAAKE